MKNILMGAILIIVTALCVLFLIQNGEQVRVNLFHLSSPEQPMWIFVLGAFVLGVVVTWLWTSLYSLKYKSKIRKQRKEMESLQKEIHQLRSQPLEALPQDDPAT